MSDVSKLIEAAVTLNDRMLDEINATTTVRSKLEAEASKLSICVHDLATREAAVLAREQAVKGSEDANKTLAKAEEIRRKNKEDSQELSVRVLEANRIEKAAKDMIGKLEREAFDFNEAKRAHSVTRREFAEQKAEWEEKVKNLGIKVG